MVNQNKKKLTKKEKIDKAKEIIEQNRAIIDSSKEEMKRDQKLMKKNGAVHYDELETQKIITGKLQEKLQRQNSYRESVLVFNVKHTRLGKLQELINKSINIKDDGSYEIISEFIEWQGNKEYTEVMVQEFELERFYYKKALMNVNYFKKALQNDGLTDAEIELVSKGEFIKTEKAVEESENKVKELEKKDEE